MPGIVKSISILIWTGLITLLCQQFNVAVAQEDQAHNPIIYADVPDMSMLRVGDTYYMSSTTMHMSPGVPIMKSIDLVNWELVCYAYDTLASVDELNLENGKNAYGKGSWASSLRYHEGKWYVSTFASTTGKTYIYSSGDIENGSWQKHSFSPSYHDNSLFFDEDGRIFLIYGAGKLSIVELKADLSGIKEGSEQVLIENASEPAGENIMLGAEGSQLFKVNGKYYLFNITWPRGGMRTVLIHRAENLGGPWEGRLALQDKGVAQGGLIDTPGGAWFAYLFRDYGSVGRIPYLVPVKWVDGWPILGDAGKVPDTLNLTASRGLIPDIVASDEFDPPEEGSGLALVWQWNHNPENKYWSLSERKGYLRLSTFRIDTSFMTARNTLTQRTFGPQCSGEICMDVSKMKEGDFAGLGLLQKKYGQLGIKVEGGMRSVVMVSGESAGYHEVESIPLNQETVFLKAECDFRERIDLACFYYSLNGKTWHPIGKQLKMEYTLPHFMGYRFALFNYTGQKPGGYVDFDYFRIK